MQHSFSIPIALSLVALFVSSCDRESRAGNEAAHSAAPSAVAPPSAAPATADARAAQARIAELPEISFEEFSRLFRELSETDQYFFSDNFVSNETSYLQIAPLLDERGRRGGGYIGVGPEQNFSYVALLEPELSFVVDIRRQNALQHLLFKAIFHEARGRAEFLSLLLGRTRPSEPKPAATIGELLAHVEAESKPDRAAFEAAHARLLRLVTDVFRIPLSKKDRETLSTTHRAFFDGQLDLQFELHEKNGRTYPKLRELFAARDPSGAERGFLASDGAFRSVQTLHQKNRIIPVVGDFAGKHALEAVAAELRKRDLPVNAFYVSNVEQYVIEPDKWRRYVANIEALPSDERSVFIRCYLDQGRRHPQQLEGHRTATVVQPFDHFAWRQKKKGYGSFWSLAIDGNLGADAGAR